MLTYIGKLLAPFALKIMAGVAIAGAVAAILFGARRAGRNAERVEGLQRQLENVKERQDVENAIGRASDDDVRRRLLERFARD